MKNLNETYKDIINEKYENIFDTNDQNAIYAGGQDAIHYLDSLIKHLKRSESNEYNMKDIKSCEGAIEAIWNELLD